LALFAALAVLLCATVVSSLSSAPSAARSLADGADADAANGPPSPLPPHAYSWRRPAILALGDSITEYSMNEGGWWQGFSGAGGYARRADCVNRGLSGYNSRWALLAADESADAFGGRLLAALIWYGANDAKEPGGAGGYDMAVPVEEYGQNLRAIAKKLRDAYSAAAASSAASWASGVGKKRRVAMAGKWPLSPPEVGPLIVIVTPGPLHEQQWLERLQGYAEQDGRPPPEVSDRLNSRLSLYAAEARRVAAEEIGGAVVVADVHRALVAAGADKGDDEARGFFTDGLHLSPKGNEVALEAIQRALEGTVADPKALPYHLPTYGQVDSADPSRTFGPLKRKGWGPSSWSS
jgi:lysophospholipase L1-like esterase